MQRSQKAIYPFKAKRNSHLLVSHIGLPKGEGITDKGVSTRTEMEEDAIA